MTDKSQTQSLLMITSVRRIQGRSTLTLSNGEILTMPRIMLKERPYRSGMPFDRASFEAFLRDRSFPFAMDRAVSLLALRARTEKEIVDSLRRNAYPEQTIARVMARLHEAGYINDADFAENWTATRAAKGLGCRKIRMELRKKGVSQEEIVGALSSIDEANLMEGALKAVQKAARGKDLSSPAERQKVLAALARRGYDFSIAKRAMQRLMDEE